MGTTVLSSMRRAVCGPLFALAIMSRAGADDAVPVPPAEELEILDPRVDPEGKPRALIVPSPDGGQLVEIPPTVIVHKFYVPGADRDFQAPLIPGGPTVIVVNHPRTGERLYVDVNLLPGIPRIKYRRDSIVYDYGEQKIILWFGACGPPKIICKESDRDDLRERAAGTGAAAAGWLERSGIPHAVHHVARGTKNAVSASADVVHTAGQAVVAPVVAVYEATPLAGLLERSAADRAAQARDFAVQRAAREQERAEATIRTVR